MTRLLTRACALTALLFAATTARAETVVTPIPTQFIASLGDPGDMQGTGAETWGLWAQDPGPRGVRLSNYDALKLTGTAPAKWSFDPAKWWLEEHGLIMEQPSFPIPAGRYVVTGGRSKMAILTIHDKGPDGHMKWELDSDAAIYDVTHLGCRAAVYTPAAADKACTPAAANPDNFPVDPGAGMPPVGGCNKQDYQVLIVVGMATEK